MGLACWLGGLGGVFSGFGCGPEAVWAEISLAGDETSPAVWGGVLIGWMEHGSPMSRLGVFVASKVHRLFSRS